MGKHKKKELMVADIVEWNNLEMLCSQRINNIFKGTGKKEKYGDAMVTCVRKIESTGKTFDEAMEIANERHSGLIESIDGDDATILDWIGRKQITLPSVEILKFVKKVS
jgi:hypothetical protein